MQNKKRPVDKRGINKIFNNRINDNSKEVQRKRILKRLQRGACTTVQLRHEEDILSPAARVHELRHKYGVNIQTLWERACNPGGGYHRVAKYVLLAGEWQGDTNHE